MANSHDFKATQQTRRQLLKLSALFSTMGALPLLQMANVARAAEPDAPLRIGYLPITDATPLLVAHHNGIFEQEGLNVEKPRLFRSWAQIVEAFLAGQVNAVHLLSPMTVWARYGSQAPAKVVAWNHMSGSGLTVQPHINNISELGGTTVAIPFWYSLHNVVLQHLLKNEGLEPISDGNPSPKQVKLVVMALQIWFLRWPISKFPATPSPNPLTQMPRFLRSVKLCVFTGDVWRDHACCVVLMHEKDLNERPEWSQKVVNGIVKAQAWIQDNRQETAQILSRDNPQKYTPHSYEALANVLEPARMDTALYESNGAIQNADWQDKRIDFQPYPFPSYTEELIRKLQSTLVSGQTEFLHALDPTFVARDLVDDRFVKQAILNNGGPAAFGIPDSFSRTETITR